MFRNVVAEVQVQVTVHCASQCCFSPLRKPVSEGEYLTVNFFWSVCLCVAGTGSDVPTQVERCPTRASHNTHAKTAQLFFIPVPDWTLEPRDKKQGRLESV